MALNPSNPRKMAQSDWDALAREIETIFVPGTAIKEQELIAGRTEQIRQLAGVVRRPGKQAIIYGDRGVGKSSIAQTFYLSIPRIGDLNAIRVPANYGDTFPDLWRKVFRRMTLESGENVASRYPNAITPDDVFLELQKFHPNDLTLIILDEIDRISDPTTKRLMGDTIKALADEDLSAKLICVGVADSVSELIVFGHESASRALVQVEMPRMSDDEMKDLIVQRLNRVQMSLSGDALWRMIFISKGLPFYGHLLGLHSSLTAISRKRIRIEERDVADGLQDALKEVDQKIREEYVKATYSERQKNIFKEVLLACALAQRDDLGRFSARSVADRLSVITGESYEVPAFAYHLDEFCQENRGRILDKIGQRRQFSFRFRDSLMEAFVVLKSLQLGLISNDKAQVLGPNRQRDLFSI
ncbi:MAG TPA: AAA family ATPase [Rhizomicrobium sp.]|nr:AAA family ATPase [Rhizomicrobium sp.]